MARQKKQGIRAAERQHDPKILAEFEREIAAWPPDQVHIALKIIRTCVAGDRAQLDALFDKQTGAYRDLTAGHLRSVDRVLKKLVGDWTH